MNIVGWRTTAQGVGGSFVWMIAFVTTRKGGMTMGERTVKVFATFLLAVTMLFILGMAKEENKLEAVTIYHTVEPGETLWVIGEKYITRDRYLPEFIEGIYALNYDKVFAKREKNGVPKKSVYPGDELEIHYWR